METTKPCVHCGGVAVYRQYTHTENVGGVTVCDPRQMAFICRDCNEVQLTSNDLASIQRRAALTALQDLPNISGGVLRYARKAVGFRQTDLAQLVGLSAETISRYETNAEPIPRTMQMAMMAIVHAKETGIDLRALIEAASKTSGPEKLVVTMEGPRAA